MIASNMNMGDHAKKLLTQEEYGGKVVTAWGTEL